MLRRTFVLGGLATTLSTSWPAGAAGGQVGADTASDLGAVSASYRRAYRTAPARQLYSAAHEHMQLVMSLIPGEQSSEIRDGLLVTSGEMAALAATILGLNLDRWPEVGPYLEISYRAAREAGDPELETVVLGCQAFRAAYGERDKRLGAEFADAAITAGRRGASRITRGWVSAVASERYAEIGDERLSRRRLDHSRAVLEKPDDGRHWSGIGSFDAVKLLAYEGGNFGRLGRHQDAVRVLSSALSTFDPSMRRHRCTALIDRAEAHHRGSDVEASCEDTRAALVLAVETQHADTVRRAEVVTRAALASRANVARSLWQDVLAAKSMTMGAEK